MNFLAGNVSFGSSDKWMVWQDEGRGKGERGQNFVPYLEDWWAGEGDLDGAAETA